MKTQAWGWLAAAVLAAGLNSSYHNGGMGWAHRIVGRVGHNTSAVLALATGRADQFMAEAQIISAHQSPSCPLSAALAQVQRSMAASQADYDRLEVLSDREQAQVDRLDANRARIEAQVARLSVVNFNSVVVRVPKVVCPRVRVNVPRMPRIAMPSIPVFHIEYSGPGPV